MSKEDPDRVKWCWMQPCLARDMSPCAFGMTAHHAGENPGKNMKAHDNTCVPLCSGHHVQLHAASGPFKKMGQEGRRKLQDRWIGECQQKYERWNAIDWF